MALPKPATAVWYVFTALLVSTIFVTHPFYVGIAFGFFLGPELLGLITHAPGDTYTEFTRWKVTDAPARFGYGVMVSALAYFRFPEPFNIWASVILAVWLPAHLAFPGVERKLWDRVRRIFS